MIARAVIVGNLTTDPESIVDGRGTKLSVAVNQRVKKNDEWQDYASFFDVTVWGNQAEACRKYTAKGSKVAIDGELRQERWEKDGNKRQAVRITAQQVQFLSRLDDANGGGPEPAEPTKQDDDIPF